MKLNTAAVLCIAILSSACASSGRVEQTADVKSATIDQPTQPQELTKPEQPATPEQSIKPQSLIARDFVHALSQVQGMAAASTTVTLLSSDRQDIFTLAMNDALLAAGYGIRWVNESGADPLFQYRQEQELAAGGIYRTIYEMAVGHVEMRRGYASDSQQRVHPVTALYIRGVDATNVEANNALFDQTIRTKADQGLSAGRATTLHNPSTLKVPDAANPLNPLVSRATAASTNLMPALAAPETQNVFDLGGSNFQNLLAQHKVVKEQVLTFANDSMRLGKLNKQLINQLVDTFDPRTDMFSVLGCSMGPTAVEGGNAALALGRADRVVEALRYAGVDSQLILDEGCWAGGGSLENLPLRGVVLTLNRRG